MSCQFGKKPNPVQILNELKYIYLPTYSVEKNHVHFEINTFNMIEVRTDQRTGSTISFENENLEPKLDLSELICTQVYVSTKLTLHYVSKT